MLSAARMAQMNRLLDEALDLDEPGRRRWLEVLAPEYEDLKPALEQALLPDGYKSGNLITLPKLAADSETQPGSGLQAGEFVGPYRLVRLLGAGGMAEVWLASRADGAYQRDVALKLPALTRLGKDLARRFARERDILAALEHPNIARLYDAGVSSDGLPYLAMEYVQGEPLTALCDAQRLGVRERLKLFLQVLDAVQYAHGRQVLHRDLKPSNILVTDSGQVRLLDFGVAKLLAQDEEHTQLTQIYGRALTPDYASPELLRGDPVEAASDIYALGVVLYELLSGSRPYRLKPGASLSALEQAVMEARVQRPSTQLTEQAASARATTPLRLSKRLRGDLDAIVLKALQRDAQDRYPSAGALADDVQRYLSGEPVEARPLRLAYRFGKFVLRHPSGVAMSAMATAVIAALIGYESMRPERAAPVAGSQAPSRSSSVATPDDKSIAVLPFVDMSEKHDQEYFSDGLSEELIDRLSHSRDLRVIARTSSFSFKGKQVTVNEIARALQVSHILEGSVRRAGNALRITAQLIKAADGSNVWSQTYERKASGIFEVQEDIAATVAQSLAVALTASRPGKPVREPDSEAHALELQGEFYLHRYNKGDTQKAIGLFEAAIRRDPDYALPWARLANATVIMMDNNWVNNAQGMPKARQAFGRAIQIDPELAYAHGAFGNFLMQREWNFSRAQAELERARELDPNNLDYAIYLSYLNSARSGRVEERVGLLRQAMARNPLDTVSLWMLANSLSVAGRWEESAAAFRHEIELNPTEAANHCLLAHDLLRLGRNDEALAEVQKETDETWKLSTLPYVYWALGRRAESDAALHQYEKQYGGSDPYTIADAHAYRGEADATFAWLERAYRERDAGMIGIKLDSFLSDLHTDPRYQALVAKLGL